MKYIYVFIFIIVFILFDLDLGYTTNSSLYTHLTYILQHASIVHLVLNSLAFISMFRTMQKFINKYLLSGLIIIISFTSSFFAMYNTPTVGASAMIYAMVGMYFGMTIFYNNIKITDIKKYLLFTSTVIISLSVSFFKPNSNFDLHCFSILFGFIASLPISIHSNKK
jgi:membrane associated rhomboid family serine protease